jgi:hypothetical protein
MPDTHEIYANAPLALVAVEIRFPEASSERPLPITLQRSFRDLLGEGWVIESHKVQQLDVAFGPGAPGSQTVRETVVPRFTVRDRTLSVAITDASLTIDGVSRVGMRYIDEIRAPGIDVNRPSAWREWLDPSLLPPKLDAMVSEEYEPAAWDGVVRYGTGTNRSLVLRYGARQGYGVEPRGVLNRPSAPSPGPLFVLDFDSFWEPSDIPEFDPAVLIETCDALRAPVRTLFDLAVTDKLRRDVFMKEPSDD